MSLKNNFFFRQKNLKAKRSEHSIFRLHTQVPMNNRPLWTPTEANQQSDNIPPDSSRSGRATKFFPEDKTLSPFRQTKVTGGIMGLLYSKFCYRSIIMRSLEDASIYEIFEAVKIDRFRTSLSSIFMQRIAETQEEQECYGEDKNVTFSETSGLEEDSPISHMKKLKKIWQQEDEKEA